MAAADALGVTVSMEPDDVQRTVERMQSHPGADIPGGGAGPYRGVAPRVALRALSWRGNPQPDAAQDSARAHRHHPAHGRPAGLGGAARPGARHRPGVREADLGFTAAGPAMIDGRPRF